MLQYRQVLCGHLPHWCYLNNHYCGEFVGTTAINFGGTSQSDLTLCSHPLRVAVTPVPQFATHLAWALSQILQISMGAVWMPLVVMRCHSCSPISGTSVALMIRVSALPVRSHSCSGAANTKVFCLDDCSHHGNPHGSVLTSTHTMIMINRWVTMHYNVHYYHCYHY